MCMFSRSWSLPSLDSTQRWLETGSEKKTCSNALGMAFFAVENGQIVNTGPLNGQHVSIEIAPDDESLLFGRPYRPETNNLDIWLNLKHGIRARSCICLGRMNGRIWATNIVTDIQRGMINIMIISHKTTMGSKLHACIAINSVPFRTSREVDRELTDEDEVISEGYSQKLNADCREYDLSYHTKYNVESRIAWNLAMNMFSSLSIWPTTIMGSQS